MFPPLAKTPPFHCVCRADFSSHIGQKAVSKYPFTNPRGINGCGIALFFAVYLTVACFGSTAIAQEDLTGLQAALIVQNAVVGAIEKSESSVVAIARVRKNRDRLAPVVDPTSPDFVPNEYATGVVIDAKGLILTTYHSLGDVADNDYYVWTGGKAFGVQRIHAGTGVKAADPWSDLAVLQIAAKDLKPITLGDGGALKKGQLVIALGNPHGIARDGDVSASWGIVSNLARRVRNEKTEDNSGTRLEHFGTLVQTDIRMPKGTSGGAIVNLKGEMVGMTTSHAALAEGNPSLGLAIPVDAAFKRIVDSLKQGKSPEFGFLGIVPSHLSASLRQNGIMGAEVSMVAQGTPAADAGLRLGDIITHIEDRPIRDATGLFREVGVRAPGTTIDLQIVRRGRFGEEPLPLTIPVVLSKKHIEHPLPTLSTVGPKQWRGMQVDWATAVPATIFQQHSHSVDPRGCIAVVSVEKDSPAWQAGIRPWRFIAKLDGQRVHNPEEFHRLSARKTGSTKIELTASYDEKTDVLVAAPGSSSGF
jgi:serine protease Do